MVKKPQTLAEYFGIDQVDFKLIDPSTFAHVIIDTQREFCDPEYTEHRSKKRRGTTHTHSIASKIASVLPAFRQTGIRTIHVFMDPYYEGFDHALGGPYLIEANENDLKFGKRDNSAIHSSTLNEWLKWNNVPNILLSGFNSGACLPQTVEPAIRVNHKVALLTDCIGCDQGEENLIPADIKKMVEFGALDTTTDEALEFLESLQAT